MEIYNCCLRVFPNNSKLRLPLLSLDSRISLSLECSYHRRLGLFQLKEVCLLIKVLFNSFLYFYFYELFNDITIIANVYKIWIWNVKYDMIFTFLSEQGLLGLVFILCGTLLYIFSMIKYLVLLTESVMHIAPGGKWCLQMKPTI